MTPTRIRDWESVLDAAQRIGKPVSLQNVTFEEYEDLIEETFGKTKMDISFNNETLKIMGQGFSHENFSRFLHNLIFLTSMTLKIKLIAAGQMTLISKKARKGADPDESYYIQNTHLASFRSGLYDEKTDTPPDLVIEIDVSNTDLEKFEIYSAFGVKEFWRYDGKDLKIYQLENENYKQIEKSISLPVLTAEKLTQLLNESQTQDQFDILANFETWLNESKTI